MREKKVVIDTIPLLSQLTGIGRYIDEIVKRLDKNGKLYFATDNQGYFESVQDCLYSKDFKKIPRRYQEKFIDILDIFIEDEFHPSLQSYY